MRQGLEGTTDKDYPLFRRVWPIEELMCRVVEAEKRRGAFAEPDHSNRNHATGQLLPSRDPTIWNLLIP
jgi:hypothetical protein